MGTKEVGQKTGACGAMYSSGGWACSLMEIFYNMEVQTYSPNHIDAIISENPGARKWRFTGFYGHPETSRRNESWALLSSLSTRNDLP